MPELPEVETVVRGLRACLTGRKITHVTIKWPGSIAVPAPHLFAQRLRARTVTGVRRRGKWVIVELDSGDTLLVHLRMTGQLLLKPADCPWGKHTRVVLFLHGGEQLRFSDMRKFGRLILTDEPGEVLRGLGPEPLSEQFTVECFQRMLVGRRGRIKSLLLNQRFLAGLGNIYVNEALWRARIHPLRPADTLAAEEVARLHRAIREVLAAAIEGGGTTLENGNFRRSDGEAGEFADQLQVYGCEGEPCRRCGAPLERTKVGQRGTFFCPQCQRRAACDDA